MFDCKVEGGKLSPIFTEEVTLTFPEGINSGYLVINLYSVSEDDGCLIADLKVYFEREGGVLTLHLADN